MGLFLKALGKKELEVFFRKRGDPLLPFLDEGVEKLLLPLLQQDDLFLDRVMANQFKYVHGSGLPDAVSPIGSLILGRLIPPGIEVDDGVGPIEIKPGTAGF